MNGTQFYFLLKNIKNASGKIHITFDEYIKYYDLDFDNESFGRNMIFPMIEAEVMLPGLIH